MPYLAEKHVEKDISSVVIRLLPQSATNSDFFEYYVFSCLYKFLIRH